MKPTRAVTLAASLLLVTASSCMKKKVYPDPLPGWHSEDYSTIFGRLQRVLAKNPDDAPVWVVRFGLSQSRFGGELALTPPEKLFGYSGGEQVEIHGSPRLDLGYPNYSGTWYEVRSIRLWAGHR